MALRPIMSNRLLRSYGRVQGRALGEKQRSLVERLLPRYGVEALPEHISELFSYVPTKMVVEIGFGGGEHLAHIAKLYPEKAYIGCEPYINGVASLLGHIEDQALESIRIFHGDARLLLESFAQASIDEIYILFPDPWPKRKHHKKRLIITPMIELLAYVLKPGGRLLLATDHEDYAGWMLSFMGRSPDFSWTANEKSDWEAAPANWTRTRYQQKAAKDGREAMFFEFVRR